MNHSRNLDAVLSGEYSHASFNSPYQQFQQEYPQLDEYGRKVASGQQFKETMGTLAGALENTSGQLMGGKEDTGKGNIMDYMGLMGITKIKGGVTTEDLLKQIERGDIPEMLKRQVSDGRPYKPTDKIPEFLKRQSR